MHTTADPLAGEARRGRSTFGNAVVGEEVLPTGVRMCLSASPPHPRVPLHDTPAVGTGAAARVETAGERAAATRARSGRTEEESR